MFVSEKMGPSKDITRADNSEFNNAKKKDSSRGDLPDFGTLVQASNAEKKVELDKEAAVQGANGQLNIGESKNDKEFREMLEKATGKKQSKNKTQLDKDDYLNLMVTQLKYQDPTKPMDNQEMATQMAQFNTVEQLMGVNKTLGAMQAQQNAGQLEKLTPYLGKNLEILGNKIQVKVDKSTSKASVDLETAANAVSIKVKDTNGNVVRSLALGSKDAGVHKFDWDGRDEKGQHLPSGTYTFAIEASTIDGKPVKGKGLMMTRAEGITDVAAGGKLESSLGSINIQDVIAIRADEALPQASVAVTPSAATPSTPAPVLAAPVVQPTAALQAPASSLPQPSVAGLASADMPKSPKPAKSDTAKSDTANASSKVEAPQAPQKSEASKNTAQPALPAVSAAAVPPPKTSASQVAMGK
jgi:flagellar basal-body rod modification protein FlgD